MLTKTDVTYECSSAQTRNLHHRVCHELRNGLLGKLFFLLSYIMAKKVEIHEETSIASNCFDVTWANGPITYNSFELLLLGWTKDTQVLTVGLFLHQEQAIKACKKVDGFFFKIRNYLRTQCISMLYTEKSILHYYVRFLQIRSHTVWCLLRCLLYSK